MYLLNYFKRGIQYVLRGQPVIVNNVTVEIAQLNNSDLLKGRVALITGGTSGIGKEIAIAFLKAGAEVIITGRNQERTELCAKELSHDVGGCVHALELDNANVSLFEEKINNILLSVNGNKIDILVNNAGINEGNSYDCTDEEYTKIMDVNLKGVFFLTRLVCEYMKANGIQGNILNISSSSSVRPARDPYSLAKWGIKGLTIGFAKKMISSGIVVNGLAPGPTKTPMLCKSDTENVYLPNNPSGRFVLPEEIANMAVILTSKIGRMIVGDTIYMTGGAGTVTVDDINY